MEDAEIVGLYWSRSQQAIAESERKYGAYCRAVSRNILPQQEDVEECVNDTWLRSWNAIPPQRPQVLQAFFGKLTRNLSLDRWRALRAEKRGGGQVQLALDELDDCLPGPSGVEEHLDARETAGVISRFLSALPETDRRLFVRRYWHLEDLHTLALRFEMSENQVKSRLYRTRQRLKTVLKEEGIAI